MVVPSSKLRTQASTFWASARIAELSSWRVIYLDPSAPASLSFLGLRIVEHCFQWEVDFHGSHCGSGDVVVNGLFSHDRKLGSANKC